MKALTLQEIQKTELELLLKYDAVCREKGLRYSLGGGTLLGAIRHRGFIPWDDDIDVMMPRPDYEAFLQICRTEAVPFRLVTYETVEGYYGLFAKIWDPATVIQDEVMDVPYEIGVNMDVFPIDGLGASEREALKIFKKTAWNREMLNAVLWKRYFRSKTHSILVEPIRLTMFVLSRFTDPKKLLRQVDEENLKHPFEDAAYAGCVCGSYREQEIMTKETFENYIDTEYEGHSLKAIRNYDEYLTKHYGDYMQLPPEEKRQTHHTYRAYWRVESGEWRDKS